MFTAHSEFKYKLLISAIGALLTSCAVNNNSIAIDKNYLNAKNIMEFDLGKSKGVLRKLPSNQFDIKLFDQMQIIELGNIPAATIAHSIRIDKNDLIIVNTPTPICMYNYRIYQVSGHNVGMWNINETLGDCNTPLKFTDVPQGLIINQLTDNPSYRVWVWQNGSLTTGLETQPLDTASAAINTPKKSTQDTPVEPSQSKPNSQISKNKKTPAPVKIDREATTPIALSKTPKKIESSEYSKVYSNQKEIKPIKITLQDTK